MQSVIGKCKSGCDKKCAAKVDINLVMSVLDNIHPFRVGWFVPPPVEIIDVDADEDLIKKHNIECIEKAEIQGAVGVQVGAEIIDVDADEDSPKKHKVEHIEKTEVQGDADAQVGTGMTGPV